MPRATRLKCPLEHPGVSACPHPTRVGSVTAIISIFAGSTYGKTDFTATRTLGSATVIASSAELPSASKGLTTGLFTPFAKKWVFGSIGYLFYSKSIIAVGDTTSTREAMGGALIAEAFVRSGMLAPSIKTDGLLTSTELSSANLVSVGLANSVTTAKNTAFGITITENAIWVNVTATIEGRSLNFTKANYPSQSFGLVLLKKDGTRTTMLVWGYNWQGTYAASLFMADPANWLNSSIAGKHLLFLNWTDGNSNGLVETGEITVASSA